MAELDNGKLKNLDQELQNLNSHLNDLDQWLKKLKNDCDAAFDEKLIKSWSESIRKIDFSKITKEQLKELRKQISETEKSFEKATTNKRFFGVKIRDNDWKNDFKDVQAAREYLQLLKQINAQEVINKANSSPSKMTEKVVTKESLEAQKKVTDELKKQEAQYKKNNNEIKRQKGALDSMLPTLQRLASAFGVAFSVRGLAQFGKKLIETRGEFERQQVALRSILQNKQLADEIWDKTMQAALQSPFTAMQLTTYTKQLAAYRIETDKLFDTTKRLADVSAGLGVDMQRLILAYGQVKAANYLRASEIRQFTEAGVNVLGELRDYFNEVKGMSVDTAQVMEMVTKRLVTFEDVEAIFKRMTDAGGIFYEMQYVQSQTVRGQIAKLHDAYDQMLNSIGQANEGALKNMVSLLNNIVKNWQEFKTVIDLIAWPLIILSLHKFALGLIAVDAAAIKASTSMSRLIVAGAKTQLMFKRLFASIANHPFIALGAAVAAVGVALLNHAKHVRDINKRYEDLMLRTYETQKNLNGLSETIQNNLDTMKKATKGSEEYNEASRENENIVKKLKDQYPELLQDLDLQKDGYEKLIEKIKEYNDELENQIRLEYAARAGFWQDDLTTNIVDLQESQRAREMQFLRNREKAENNYLELKAKGKEASEKELDALIRSAKTWQEQYDILIEFARTQGARSSGYELPIGLSAIWGRDVETRTKDLEKNIENESLVFNDIIRDQLKTINEDLGDDIQQFITDNETQINELFKDKEGAGWKLLNKQITKFFTAKGATDKETREAIQNLLNEYLLIPIQLDWDNIGGTSGSTTPPQTSGNKTKENASKLISLIKEMRSEYDKLSKSAYGYAKSEEKVRKAYKQSYEDILKETGVAANFDFTTNEGEIEALKKVRDYIKGNAKYAKDAWKDVQKTIDQLTAETEIEISVRIREDFGKQMEKAFGDYELTIELEKLNISPEAAKDLFPAFDPQTLGQMRDALKRFYDEKEEQGVAFDEEDLKEFQKWADKIDAEILKSRKERAKEYSKFLEKEYSERAKVEMQYAKDVAFVTANFSGQQQKNILEGINDKFQKDIAELNWKSFKESSFYVEMMDDLSSVPIEYMKLMLSKIEEILQNPEALPPRALKEAINARQKIIEAQMDFDQIAVMKESMAEIREAAKDEEVGGKTWRQTKKRLDEEQKAQAEKLAGIEEEIRVNEKLQGQLKGLEDRQKAYNDARKNLSSETISELDELNDPQSLMNEYEADIAIWQKRVDELKSAEGEASSEMNDEIVRLEEKIRLRRIEIDLLEKYKESLRGLGAYESTEEGQAAVQAQGTGQTSTSVGGKITQGKKDAENVTKRLSTLQKWQKAFKNFNDSFSKFNKNAADMVGRLGALSTAAFDLYEALGGETDAMTKAWKEFGGTIVNTITEALTMIPSLVAGFVTAGSTINAAMGIIGLIAEAIQLVLVLITGLAKLHDAGYEAEIERQQKKIDELQRAYERLEKAIDKTWDTASYIRTYNEEAQNLYQQIEALNKQMAAEESKKNFDKDKLQDYKDKIQDAEDELENLKQAQIDVFGGIGEEGYRDAAQGFVDAWKSAFLETGDGLQGLQDHFDEFLQDWFVKQATMRVTNKMLEPLFRQIDNAVDKSGAGGANVLMQELQNVREKFGVLAPQLSEALEEIAGMWGMGGEGSLSGLAAGIQGMTEEQANILEAYWNSVRGYTASIDMNVATIVSLLSDGNGSGRGNIFGDPNVNTNPMLQQLSLIAANTQATHQLLQSVTKSGHSQGGYGIKVFAD